MHASLNTNKQIIRTSYSLFIAINNLYFSPLLLLLLLNLSFTLHSTNFREKYEKEQEVVEIYNKVYEDYYLYIHIHMCVYLDNE